MDDAAPPEPRSTRMAALVAWGIIAACVSLAMWAALQPARNARLRAEPPTTQRDLQLRYAVGIYELMSTAGSGVLEQVDSDLASPGSQLRVAPVAGHLLGGDEAVRRLDALAVHPDLGDDPVLLKRIYRDGPASLSNEERTALADRLGWSGELALIHGAPSDDAQRAVVLGAAKRTALTLVGAIVFAIALLVTGIIVAMVLIVRWNDGRLRGAYPTPQLVATRHGSACIEGFAVYLVTFIASGKLLGMVPGAGLSATWLYLPVVPLVLVATVRRGMAWSDLRQAIGWHRGRGIGREVGAGLLGWLAGVPLIALSLMATMALSRHYPASHPIEQVLVGADALTLLAMGALASIFAPIVEETMFRGLLFHHLRTRWAWLPAALISSLIFAMLHPQGIAALPALTSVALVLAAIRAWRGSLIAPIAAHALHNGLLLVVVVLSLG